MNNEPNIMPTPVAIFFLGWIILIVILGLSGCNLPPVEDRRTPYEKKLDAVGCDRDARLMTGKEIAECVRIVMYDKPIGTK